MCSAAPSFLDCSAGGQKVSWREQKEAERITGLHFGFETCDRLHGNGTTEAAICRADLLACSVMFKALEDCLDETREGVSQYSLNEHQRDALLCHVRSDAASVFSLSTDILTAVNKSSSKLKTQLNIIIALLIANLFTLVWLLH